MVKSASSGGSAGNVSAVDFAAVLGDIAFGLAVTVIGIAARGLFRVLSPSFHGLALP
jgi:hypothetical protein